MRGLAPFILGGSATDAAEPSFELLYKLHNFLAVILCILSIDFLLKPAIIVSSKERKEVLKCQKEALVSEQFSASSL